MDWYEDVEEDIDTWRTFKEEFTAHFATEDRRTKWQCELSNMRQAPGERLTAYMTRFRKLVSRVDPDTELPDSHLIRSFMQGLRSNYGPLIAMQLSNVNTLTGLYQVVREIENSIIYEPEYLEKNRRTTGGGGRLEKEIEELANQMKPCH